MNTFGRLFRLTTFGESHGPALGSVVDGCPAGVPLRTAQIQAALDRRRPGQSAVTTARQEADRVEILSGVYEDKTLGTPIAAIVRNENQRSGDYQALQTEDRPGHADRVWRERYGHRDHRGGGRTSGRETLCRVIGGSIAEALLARDLPAVSVVAWVAQVGPLRAAEPGADLTRAAVDAHPTRCPDPAVAARMSEIILDAKGAGDSLGGIIALRVSGLPVGLGEPVFGKLKARLADAFSGVGAVTGVHWGPPDLFSAIERLGTEFHASAASYGGIQGGLSNGEPLEARVLFKPPATLGAHARSGRHDPCILPRAVPVLEAMASLVLADAWLQLRAFPHQRLRPSPALDRGPDICSICGVAIRCPKCRSSMAIVRFDEIEVDRCTGCGGLWFDTRELDKLKGRKGVEILDTGDPLVGRKNNEVDLINCPRCTTRMVRLVDPAQPHIWFESCSVCGGAYFDAGEFRDFVTWSPLDVFWRIFGRPRN